MPSTSSPPKLSLCFCSKRLLFRGSGGTCSPLIWSCRLVRPGLGFMVGGLLNRLLGVRSEVPLVECSLGSFSADSCLLNLFTILLTFPPERLVPPPLSPRGGELVCADGFGGMFGLCLASGLRGKVNVGSWDASWTDIVASLMVCLALVPDQSEVRLWGQRSMWVDHHHLMSKEKGKESSKPVWYHIKCNVWFNNSNS